MDLIFFERQEGSLCAQHCLNSLLQGEYFNPVALGIVAQGLDDEERMWMAESGEESEEYQRFLQQPSQNMDDSGYFSVQVLSRALEAWGLELVPYTSTEDRAREAFKNPSKMQAFICHYKDHWFTIRRIGNQWFNLNSLLPRPELISDTYLALFLAQLQQEGYSIFVVFGSLPECEADKILKITPVVPVPKTSTSRVAPMHVDADDAEELAKAIEASLSEAQTKPHSSSTTITHVHTENAKQKLPQPNIEDDRELQKALSLSLQAFEDDDDSSDEEAQLRRAMAMSLECRSNTPSAPSTPNADYEEIRKKRLMCLEHNQKDRL